MAAEADADAAAADVAAAAGVLEIKTITISPTTMENRINVKMVLMRATRRITVSQNDYRKP